MDSAAAFKSQLNLNRNLGQVVSQILDMLNYNQSNADMIKYADTHMFCCDR